MHPAFVLIPAAALIIGPRWWAAHVLKEHHREDDPDSGTARDLARELLDTHQLQAVQIEVTDIGDHYDHLTRTVRLARDKADRRTLTAVTTAAHEVAHAVQHATGYPPFAWRANLARLASVTGRTGTLLLLAVPAAAVLSRQRLPPVIIGSAALTMLGTGVAAQLSAIPVELDASFRRALPMLRDGYVAEARLEDARRILLACSLTYVASSLMGIVHIWPWLGGVPVGLLAGEDSNSGAASAESRSPSLGHRSCAKARKSRGIIRGGGFEAIFSKVAKPLVRQWLHSSKNL